MRAVRGVCRSGVECAGAILAPYIDAGNALVEAIKPLAKATARPGAEHMAYPLVVKLIAQKRLCIEDGCVVIEGGSPSGAALLNPQG
jgi:hypothetical protein